MTDRAYSALQSEADAGTRTPDPFITSDGCLSRRDPGSPSQSDSAGPRETHRDTDPDDRRPQNAPANDRLFDDGDEPGAPAPARPAPVEDLERFASISHCKRYRFGLMRAWVDRPERYVMFVGLNPSTADGMVEDPTLRRCIRFARDWGYDGLWLGNLFALRTPYPQELRQHADPVGPVQTDNWLRWMRRQSELVVACWGADPVAVLGTDRDPFGRASTVLELLGDVHCLGVTKDGAPRHPLYLRADARPTPWTQETAA